MPSRLFVSDAHLNAGWDAQKLYQYPFEWLNHKDLKNFVDFLGYIAKNAKDYSELVFLGDMADTWIYPIDKTPPTIQQVLTAEHNKPVISALNAICDAGIGLLVLLGNHDMEMTADDLRGVLPKARFGAGTGGISVFQSSRVHAEHGSAYALFNAPDPINNSRTRLPLGYFISRVIATRTARTGKSNREYARYADDLLECLGPQTLAQSVFEALLEEAKIADSEIIQLPGGSTTTAGEIKQRYANLYEQWSHSKGAGSAFKAVMAEISYLDDVADNLCKKGGTNVVVFGHSHEPKFDKDTWFVADRIYANSGAWCEGKGIGQFVKTAEITAGTKRRQQVSLCQWAGGEEKLLKQDSVLIDGDS